MNAPAAPLVELRGVRKRYNVGLPNEAEVLHGLDLDLQPGDFLALGRPLPGVEPGERLAILGAGAYGFVMSSNYNTRGRAAEVLISEGNWAVVRPREQVDELFKTEAVDPFTPVTVGKPK